MRQVWRIGIAVSVMLASVTPSNATEQDYTVQEFLFNYQMYGHQEGSFLNSYFYGITEGISWSAAVAHSDFEVDIYCPPDHLAGTNQFYFDILRNYVQANPENKVQPASTLPVVMVRALQAYYPCY
ncbi:hypothetical protein [Rhodospira trueperi]|uniref:Rap1a immunity protein domain-containing protein n=1 Tax=Rhodospira trueperi TaxID=69960 RepID=A0A1G7GE87_9PROT|nr:hypothetical protein [Rhodospira trueperi]SDE86468.1 hypothetical protein SAMN05421720_11460 [Rhodospira trueperi]